MCPVFTEDGLAFIDFALDPRRPSCARTGRVYVYGRPMLNSLSRLARRALSAEAPARAGRWFSRDEAIMGTAIHVELWSDERAAANTAIDAVMREMHRIDALMSPYKESSELSRINREAARRPVEVCTELFDLLARSIAFSELSGGAFDITYASAGHLYDYRRRIRPSEEQLAAAREAIGYRHLQLDPVQRTVRFARDGVKIDLGGFAKGHAVDNGAAILARHGVRHAAVAAGGDSRMLGDRCGRPWMVGVRDPRREGEVIALLPLEDAAVSTSGDYERYFDDGDERCHHLIDPRTGKSPREVRSVTVIAPDGLTSEALSKTVFVLGVERGLRIVESIPEVDAVVVDAAGQLHYSQGLLPGGQAPRN
ncbi:MAG TPA: FAD:protein FMN transferase [Burkholderiaceae bacterium]|nr:FAD:protein FMN transferase [Burkholderiaceae bacterium]